MYTPGMRGAWYDFCRWLVRNTVYRATGGLKGVGAENVPREGAVILAPVHLSHLDPPAVACTCHRRLNFMAKQELFKVPILGPLIRSLGAFPVKRGEGDTEAIRHTMAELEKGHVVLVFPEGTRGDGVHIQAINKGVTMIARRSGALVVPVGIVGTHRVLPKGASKPKRHPITILFGKPFRYDDVQVGTEKENREAFAARLQASLVELCAAGGMPLKNEPSNRHSEESGSNERQA